MPVRTYSIGMFTCLGFAFATSIDPGILLMDEGISAGDARFADRAAERMASFLERSRIVVIALRSPDPLDVQQSCINAYRPRGRAR